MNSIALISTISYWNHIHDFTLFQAVRSLQPELLIAWGPYNQLIWDTPTNTETKNHSVFVDLQTLLRVLCCWLGAINCACWNIWAANTPGSVSRRVHLLKYIFTDVWIFCSSLGLLSSSVSRNVFCVVLSVLQQLQPSFIPLLDNINIPRWTGCRDKVRRNVRNAEPQMKSCIIQVKEEEKTGNVSFFRRQRGG